MNVVIQEHPEGCGLACVAMLAELSYGEVTRIAAELGIHAGDKGLYNSTVLMRRLLAKLDICVGGEERVFGGWDDLPNLCLLATKWHVDNGVPHWHWVVSSRDGGAMRVLDPAAYLEVNARTDLEAIAPQWFIEVIT